MKINITVKINPETGQAEELKSDLHDAYSNWIADALDGFRNPITGELLPYEIISSGADSTPTVRVVDPAFQALAESLIQEKSIRESPFQ